MPLLRGRIIGYDVRLMMFNFTMLTSDARTIDCAISSSAMDRLSGTDRYLRPEREALFFEVRDTIEHIASETFDRENAVQIRIFAKDISDFLPR